MKTILSIFVLFFISSTFISAQTILNPGDVAIVGINCDNPNDFAFVLLTDIEAGTVINITDDGWKAEGGFRQNEGVVTYTSPSSLPAGTIIINSVNSANFVVSGNFSLTTNGDQLIVFQGNINTPSLIYALNNYGAGVWQADAQNSNTSALPTGLVNGFSAVALYEVDNAYYSEGPYSDINLLRSLISDNANWTGDDLNTFDFTVVLNGNLPVELSYFTAEVNGAQILLNWITRHLD